MAAGRLARAAAQDGLSGGGEQFRLERCPVDDLDHEIPRHLGQDLLLDFLPQFRAFGVVLQGQDGHALDTVERYGLFAARKDQQQKQGHYEKCLFPHDDGLLIPDASWTLPDRNWFRERPDPILPHSGGVAYWKASRIRKVGHLRGQEKTGDSRISDRRFCQPGLSG